MFYLLYIHLTALNTASSRKHKESSNSEWNYRITFREKYHFHGLYCNCFHRLLWGKLIRTQSVRLTADPFSTSWNQIRTKLGSKWFVGSFGSSTASRKNKKLPSVWETPAYTFDFNPLMIWVTSTWRLHPSPEVQIQICRSLGWTGRRTASSVWTLGAEK